MVLAQAWRYAAVQRMSSLESGDLDPRSRVDGVRQGQAVQYAWWFGKGLPHPTDFEEAEAMLVAPSLKGWNPVFPEKEWTSGRAADELERVIVDSGTLAEPIVVDASDAPKRVYFRSAIPLQVGLLTKITPGAPPIVLAEPRTIHAVLDRSRFTRWHGVNDSEDDLGAR